MSILMRLCCFLLLLSASACIGSSGSLVHLYGGKDQRQHGSKELDAALNQQFVGMSKDQLIINYGLPNRTATLDNGFKLMQYNSKRTSIDYKGNRSYSNCELRLWLRDKKVHHLDYLGDQVDCAHFAVTARRGVIEDERPPK